MISPSGLRPAILALAAFVLAGCVDLGPPPPAPPVRPNGQALWRIIHDQCVPNQRDHGDPAPCALVSVKGGEAHGYVVLKDRTGVAQHLLMPTAKITGIEDPQVLAPDALNYFARAWDQRGFAEAKLGHPVDRALLSITVNSAYGRTQDQLHLHISCVDAEVVAGLRDAPRPRAWGDRPITLKGRPYRILWLPEDQLEATNPFQLLARTIPGARRSMGAWTLALIGAAGPDGQPGFFLLADRADPRTGDRGSAEELQDHACESVPHG